MPHAFGIRHSTSRAHANILHSTPDIDLASDVRHPTSAIRRATPGSRGPALLLSVVGAALLSACARQTPFSEQNARAHIDQLAGTIGSRPVASEANRRAREYLIDQLRFFGYAVRVQETDAERPELGLTAHVQNIIAIVPGARP